MLPEAVCHSISPWEPFDGRWHFSISLLSRFGHDTLFVWSVCVNVSSMANGLILTDSCQWLPISHSKLLDLDTAYKYPDTLTSMNNLALVLSGQGEHAQAQEMRRQVLGLREIVLSKKHPDTLASMANLASTYWNQWNKAENPGCGDTFEDARTSTSRHVDGYD